MTTNETSFFREMAAFDAFRTVILPELLAARTTTRQLNLWCAACSSGQEPYSIAMVLREEARRLEGWRVRLIASDLSEEMLTRAREARYSQLEVNRGLPARYLLKYFRRCGLDWQLNDDTRGAVELRRINLAGTWPSLPAMDVVFLRNVMIYFSQDTRRAVLQHIHRQLRPDGYLLLGTAETVASADSNFRSTMVGKTRCYRRTT
jgi:chemotaxis protein methyltransferase CheR